MRGVHLNGLLASTAVALLLSAGGALAQAASPSGGDSSVSAPAGAKAAPAANAATATDSKPAGDSAEKPSADSSSPAPAAAASGSNHPDSKHLDSKHPESKQAGSDSADKPSAGKSAAAPAGAAAASDANSRPAEPKHADTGNTDKSAPAKSSTPPAAAAGGSAPQSAQSTHAADHPEAPAAAGAPSAPGQAAPAAAAAKPAAHENEKAGAAAPTPAPAKVASPASNLSPLDQQVADQLHQLSSGKFDRIVGGKSERAAIDAFYSGRAYAPLWVTDGHASEHAKAAMTYLAHVGADGLDPADYAVPNFSAFTDPQKLAEAELKFSAAVVTYAHHAAIGRVAWSRVDANIEYDTKAPDPASVLAKLADAKDTAAALDSYEPHAPGYLALKAKLAEIRGGGSDGLKPAIAHGRVLKIGDQDSRVAQLRDRLGVDGDGDIYDKAIAAAVKNFQKEHGLKPTGTLTAATVAAFDGPRPTHATDVILANMERWRWMPHDLGNNYVMINLPDFTASVFHDGKRIWKTKIVIGKPDMPTPIITANMKFITVNPTWHVPPSIINREYLPALAADPTVLQRMGLVVERSVSGRVTGIYQPPGDRNAEGRLRFNFPNKFLVYQHDTPDKYMFGYAKRAFSHGCMRTQDPAKYAEVLLSLVRPNDGYTKRRIEQMYGPRETNIEFPTTIPVHVTYQTALVDDSGKLEFRDDVYGRDRELLAVLHNSSEMRVADIPVEHRIAASHREIMQAADNMPSFGRYDGQGGPGPGGGGFFSRIFGGGFGPPPTPPARVPRRRRVSDGYPNWGTYER